MTKTHLGSIADIITGPFGSALHQYEYVDEGVPVIMPQDIENRNVSYEKIAHITLQKAEELSRYAVIKNDIVYARRGDIEKHAFITSSTNGAICGTGCLRVRVKDTSVNPLFLSYYLDRPETRKWIVSHAVGSNMPNLNTDILSNIPVELPSKEEQDSIVSVLECIEKQIDNKTTICFDLETMAKLLYDYWFVQFDFPGADGKPYKSSGGKMVWNEKLKREIPEGWVVHSLQAYILSSKNGDWGNEIPKKEDDIEVRCFRGADFASITSNYQTTAPVRYISKNNSDRLLSDGDLVVEISGGSPVQSTGRVGYINQKFLDRCGGVMDCSNFCKAFTPKKRIYQYWLYQTWKMYYDAGVMFNFESKTTGIKNLMFDSVIRDIKIPLPPDKLLSEYQNRVSLFYDKIQDIFIESAELAELRDFLLPMLMNGQVKIEG